MHAPFSNSSSWALRSTTWPLRRLVVVSVFLTFVLILFTTPSYYPPAHTDTSNDAITKNEQPSPQHEFIAQYFIDYPSPISDFGEMARRVQFLQSWISESQKPTKAQLLSLSSTPDITYPPLLENLTLSLFPFIQPPYKINENDTTPSTLQTLFSVPAPGTRGIVLPASASTFRFTTHLLLNLRTVLHCSLPIQIVYSGNEELPPAYRKALLSLSASTLTFLDLSALDLFNSTIMNIKDPKATGWAIKPFALLSSPFQETILIDSSVIFVLDPRTLFSWEGYKQKGALFFHDRLFGKGKHENEDRHTWLEYQLRHLQNRSAELTKSVMMRGHYAQEAESGVVVVDKGRLGVVMGLLLACWMNSRGVRDDVTYQRLNGDKETYWLAMELLGQPYTFAHDYGAAIGQPPSEQSNPSSSSPLATSKLLTSQIAQLDGKGRLVWLDGSLMKRKGAIGAEFAIFERLMTGGLWEFGDKEGWIASMVGGEERELSAKERGVLERTVLVARKVDERFGMMDGGL